MKEHGSSDGSEKKGGERKPEKRKRRKEGGGADLLFLSLRLPSCSCLCYSLLPPPLPFLKRNVKSRTSFPFFLPLTPLSFLCPFFSPHFWFFLSLSSFCQTFFFSLSLFDLCFLSPSPPGGVLLLLVRTTTDTNPNPFHFAHKLFTRTSFSKLNNLTAQSTTDQKRERERERENNRMMMS